MSVNYWWFEGDSVKTIAKQILKAGSENVRLKVIPNGEQMLLQVVPRGGVAATEAGENPPVNESHVCPPWC